MQEEVLVRESSERRIGVFELLQISAVLEVWTTVIVAAVAEGAVDAQTQLGHLVRERLSCAVPGAGRAARSTDHALSFETK